MKTNSEKYAGTPSFPLLRQFVEQFPDMTIHSRMRIDGTLRMLTEQELLALVGCANFTDLIAAWSGQSVAGLLREHDIEEAKHVLHEAGYLTGSMFQLEDIIAQASNRDIELTREQANEIRHYIEHNHDANNGICWDVIDSATDYCFPELTNR